MNQQQKEARYCAVCGIKGTHTTLDHRACPKKINILRERAQEEREKRIQSNMSCNREIELIRKAINISSEEEFPQIRPQNSKIATIITLALLDEASSPGIFENKLKEACNNNGIPEIKYKLEPNTARDFRKTLCGASTANNINKSSTPNLSKYYNDTIKQKQNINQEEESVHENSELTNRNDKKIRKITVNTQKGATALTTDRQLIE